ncbi:MAG: hypothetical protein V3V13_09940 [Paracoccaceae bacterium]
MRNLNITITFKPQTRFWTALHGFESQERDYRITFKSSRGAAQNAGIMAGFAITPLPKSSCTDQVIALDASYGLPPLPDLAVGMMIAKDVSPPACAVADHLRSSFVKISRVYPLHRLATPLSLRATETI